MPQMFVGFISVKTRVLEVVGLQLFYQSYTPALLPEVNHGSTFLSYLLERRIELRSTITSK